MRLGVARGGVDAKVEMPHAANRVNASFIEEEEGCLLEDAVSLSVTQKGVKEGKLGVSIKWQEITQFWTP